MKTVSRYPDELSEVRDCNLAPDSTHYLLVLALLYDTMVLFSVSHACDIG
jgi:hypothetical protein